MATEVPVLPLTPPEKCPSRNRDRVAAGGPVVLVVVGPVDVPPIAGAHPVGALLPPAALLSDFAVDILHAGVV